MLVDKEESFRTALIAMDSKASKFGLRVSFWTKTKLQNFDSEPKPLPVMVDGNIVDPVEEFTYLDSMGYSRVTLNRNISGALDLQPMQ